MVAAMRARGGAAALYFVAVQALGSWIVINGLVAILINSLFAEETRRVRPRRTRAAPADRTGPRITKAS
eukprot:tig00020563_g11280.t1